MPHTGADVLEVYEHDTDEPIRYENVQYTPWTAKGRRGLTVHTDGGEIQHDDIHTYEARRRH